MWRDLLIDLLKGFLSNCLRLNIQDISLAVLSDYSHLTTEFNQPPI